MLLSLSLVACLTVGVFGTSHEPSDLGSAAGSFFSLDSHPSPPAPLPPAVQVQTSPPQNGNNRAPVFSPPQNGNNRAPVFSPPQNGNNRAPVFSPPQNGNNPPTAFTSFNSQPSSTSQPVKNPPSSHQTGKQSPPVTTFDFGSSLNLFDVPQSFILDRSSQSLDGKDGSYKQEQPGYKVEQVYKQPEQSGYKVEQVYKQPEQSGYKVEQVYKQPEQSGYKVEQVYKQPEQSGYKVEQVYKQPEHGYKVEQIYKQQEDAGSRMEQWSRSNSQTGYNIPQGYKHSEQQTYIQPGYKPSAQSSYRMEQGFKNYQYDMEQMYKQPEQPSYKVEQVYKQPEQPSYKVEQVYKQPEQPSYKVEQVYKQPEQPSYKVEQPYKPSQQVVYVTEMNPYTVNQSTTVKTYAAPVTYASLPEYGVTTSAPYQSAPAYQTTTYPSVVQSYPTISSYQVSTYAPITQTYQMTTPHPVQTNMFATYSSFLPSYQVTTPYPIATSPPHYQNNPQPSQPQLDQYPKAQVASPQQYQPSGYKSQQAEAFESPYEPMIPADPYSVSQPGQYTPQMPSNAGQCVPGEYKVRPGGSVRHHGKLRWFSWLDKTVGPKSYVEAQEVCRAQCLKLGTILDEAKAHHVLTMVNNIGDVNGIYLKDGDEKLGPFIRYHKSWAITVSAMDSGSKSFSWSSLLGFGSAKTGDQDEECHAFVSNSLYGFGRSRLSCNDANHFFCEEP